MKTILALALLLVFSFPVTAADNQLPGGRGLGFNCDVIDAKCTCKGARNGADCKAMKNCDGGHIPVCSVDTTTRKPIGCECNMALSAKKKGIPDASIDTITQPKE